MQNLGVCVRENFWDVGGWEMKQSGFVFLEKAKELRVGARAPIRIPVSAAHLAYAMRTKRVRFVSR